ncbi:MAG: hypothetical protein EOO88_09580, partial [Pedobacter sp.]
MSKLLQPLKKNTALLALIFMTFWATKAHAVLTNIVEPITSVHGLHTGMRAENVTEITGLNAAAGG